MKSRKKELRKGFSSGTAVVAGVVGAIRSLYSGFSGTGKREFWCAVKLPVGFYLPVSVAVLHVDNRRMIAITEVKKDGGDDPDVTHGAIFRAEVRLFRLEGRNGIFVKAGKGIGFVTREGLPVRVGEPAINPVPRKMLKENVEYVLSHWPNFSVPSGNGLNTGADIFLSYDKSFHSLPSLFVDITVPRGESLAQKTLNPKLGIVGGISILGTTGIVTPFSHEAFQETIVAAMKFARKHGCTSVVLSTGGKSEKYAKRLLSNLPDEAFVQIADFFEFSVVKAYELGFSELIHALFFGKTLKMALGYKYTHAHSSNLDIEGFVKKHLFNIPKQLAEEIKQANTARHMLDILKRRNRLDIVRRIAEIAIKKSREFLPGINRIRLFLFDYDGSLLCSLENMNDVHPL